MIMSFKDYFKDPLNLIDICRLSSTIVWIILESNYLLTSIMLIFNLLRGLTIFTLFDDTRYYISLIKRALWDIGYFFLLFSYSTFAFGLLLVVSNHEAINFHNLWGSPYDMNFGTGLDGNINEDLNLEYVFYFIASIINVVLMLNLLISILGDSYDHFQLDIGVINLKEKALLGLEIQKIMFWNRNKIDESYIHSFTDASVDDNETNDKWKGKLNYLQMNIKEDLSLLEENNEKRFKAFEENIESRLNSIEQTLQILIETILK